MSLTLETPAPAAPVVEPTLKQRQQATWAAGDYAIVGTTLQIVGESLAEAIDIRAGEHVLDVAAGNGNATLAAARRHALVTSTDYVTSLLDKGRGRANAEGMLVRFQAADVENLPFDDGSYDVVLSTFGAMFAPDQERTAAEMLRVVRRGGRIGLANWTPESFIGRLFKLLGRHLPPPPGVRSPALWGTGARLAELFDARVATISSERKVFNFRYRSPAHWLQVFRDFYGPIHMAFRKLDDAGKAALEREILALLAESNVAGETSLVVPSAYLEVIVTKR